MADTMFDVEELATMKRAQLQKLCKKFGIKANSKTSHLIVVLRKYAKTHFSHEQDKDRAVEEEEEVLRSVEMEVTTVVKSLKIKNIISPAKHVEELPTGTDTQPEPTDSEEDAHLNAYKEQVMKQLEKKVQDTLKSVKYECKIPRLAQFLNKSLTDQKTPKNGKDWTKIHSKQFQKMDSIDVYLEKKRKRTQSFYQTVKRAKRTATQAKSAVAKMQAAHNTPGPSKMLTRKRMGNQGMISKSVTIANPATKSTEFSFLKSPKDYKPVFSGFGVPMQKTPATRKSVAFVTRTEDIKTKTPAGQGAARKSFAGTPFRFSAVGNTTIGSPMPSKKKFDLQASLAKPLHYQPHKGKLKTVPFTKRGTNIPKASTVRCKIPVDHEVEIKNVKVTSRAGRRKAEMKNKANKRKDAASKRRGLVC